MLGLGAGPVGEPDDREAGQAAVDVRLHLDAPRLDADESVGDGAREHSSHGMDAPVTGVSRSSNDSATDQDRLEVLTGTPAGTPVDVPLEPLVEP